MRLVMHFWPSILLALFVVLRTLLCFIFILFPPNEKHDEGCVGDALPDLLFCSLLFSGGARVGLRPAVVVSHIQRIGRQPEKSTLIHGGQSPSRYAEQGKENKKTKRKWSYTTTWYIYINKNTWRVQGG